MERPLGWYHACDLRKWVGSTNPIAFGKMQGRDFIQLLLYPSLKINRVLFVSQHINM